MLDTAQILALAEQVQELQSLLTDAVLLHFDPDREEEMLTSAFNKVFEIGEVADEISKKTRSVTSWPLLEA